MFLKYLMGQSGRVCLVLTVAILPLLSGRLHSSNALTETTTLDWATPAAMAVKHVSLATYSQLEPTLLQNTDCFLEDYRVVSSSTQRSGCFTSTAFGTLESDSDMAIFNGSDEAVPLLRYDSGQIIVPWPQAGTLLSLEVSTGDGAALSIYKDPLGSLQEQRNLLGQLVAKQLIKPPDLPIKTPAGQQLVVNPQTLAFSGNGAWLVAEDVHGSFVRVNLATLDMTAFAPAFASSGSPGLLQSQVSVSDNGRYVAIYNGAADSFRVYDLTRCQSSQTTGTWPQQCASYDYEPYIRHAIGGLQFMHHVRFVNDGLLSFEAFTSSAANTGVYVLAPKDSIHSLIDYLGVGDSYTAGEGAFNYQTGTDTSDDACHLSVHSYPVLLTHDLFSPLGGRSVACSGAVIRDIASTGGSYRGQNKGVATFDNLDPALLTSVLTNFIPGYIAQQRFVAQYQPGVVTVSVGGNDIGFADTLLRCVLPHVSRHFSDETCFNTYEDRLELMQLIDRTIPRWTALYRQLQAESLESRIYAIGYPQIISDQGSCGVNVLLSKEELEFASELTDYVNNAMKTAAGKAGVNYVDISQALKGHRLCETGSADVAVNGLTAGRDAGPLGAKIFGKESYHPNALGQSLIETAILRQTNNLTTTITSTAVAGNTDLLSAPKSGRAVNIRIPDDTLTAAQATSGSQQQVTVDGQANGLKTHTAYMAHLDGPSGPIIGQGVSDGNSSLNIPVTIPSGSEPGIHTIDVTGPNQADEPVDITQPIYIPGSPTDSGGDTPPTSTPTGTGTTSDNPPALTGEPGDSPNNPVLPVAVIPTMPALPTPTVAVVQPDSIMTAAALAETDYASQLAAPSSSLSVIQPTGSAQQPHQALPESRTLNPNTVLRHVFVRPASQKQTNRLPMASPIKQLHWQPWLILPILSWLLLVLVFIGLQRLLSRSTQRDFG